MAGVNCCMINLFRLYEAFLAQANTYQGGHVKPVRVFTSWVRDISLSFFKKGCQEYERNQLVTDRMATFLKTVNVMAAPAKIKGYSVASYPKDYAYFAAARYFVQNDVFRIDPKHDVLCLDNSIKSCDQLKNEEKLLHDGDTLNEVNIDKVDASRWGALLEHRLTKPTLAKPKITQYDLGFKISPSDIDVFVLDYFRLPKAPVFNYEITNANTEDEYMQFIETGSQHLEWPEDMIPEFIEELMSMYKTYTRQQQQ